MKTRSELITAIRAELQRCALMTDTQRLEAYGTQGEALLRERLAELLQD